MVKVPLWAALAPALAGLAIGGVGAQLAEQKPAAQKQDAPELAGLPSYPFLPPTYAQPFVPSIADWQALRLSAYGASTTRITDNFSRQQLSCFLTPKGLAMTLDLLPQPEWKHYAGQGRFAAPLDRVRPDLQQAVDFTLKYTRNFFPEIKDGDITIALHIRSERVGVWENGKLSFTVDKQASRR